MSGLPTDQVLAILRLRQWQQDRALLRTAKATGYNRNGWSPRRCRQADARLVRVIDFERAFTRLGQDEQAALISIYRDRLGHSEAAALIGFSNRSLAYLLPAARQHLADILDRLDLL